MNEYTCHHCGKPIVFLAHASRQRVCPHCGRRLHTCDNCEFSDVTGCVLNEAERFAATHGIDCDRFQFRVTPAKPIATS